MLVEIKKINKEEVTAVTSIDVAETFGKEHYHILRDIEKMECSGEFRESNFGVSSYRSTQNKKLPMYYMTKDGFTILAMSYTGERAMKFKEAYIKQFNAMEDILVKKMKEREKGIAVRQALTNALKQSRENERMHGHAYSNYTNAIYKALLGKSANQLREKFCIGKNVELRNSFSAEELKEIQSAECLVSGLIDCGWGYEQIKDFIEENLAKKIAI